jgi:hypothetical protein
MLLPGRHRPGIRDTACDPHRGGLGYGHAHFNRDRKCHRVQNADCLGHALSIGDSDGYADRVAQQHADLDAHTNDKSLAERHADSD